MHKALMKVPTHMKLSMTGSMIMNHPEEIFGRLRWMFPDRYSSKWRDWNNRFLEYVESGYGKVLVGPNPDRVDAMRRELGVFTVYRRKADELDLPAKTEQTLRVELRPAQRRAYDELAKSYVTTLDSGEAVVGLEPVVLLTRLRQIATGLELVSGEVADSTKLDVAVEMVRDNPDDPFVIFSWFKAAAVALAERLEDAGVGVQICTGDTTHKQRADRIAAFQRGEGRVFVGTISTLGESVNLQRASQAIFLDRSWNPAQNEQAADRIYRIGQENPVTVTYLVAKDTVDEYNVLPTIANKEAIRRMILGGN
jgi:SNF2 family DNA or RNA helicase